MCSITSFFQKINKVFIFYTKYKSNLINIHIFSPLGTTFLHPQNLLRPLAIPQVVLGLTFQMTKKWVCVFQSTQKVVTDGARGTAMDLTKRLLCAKFRVRLVMVRVFGFQFSVECRVLGIGRASVFGFRSVSGSKKVGFLGLGTHH